MKTKYKKINLTLGTNLSLKWWLNIYVLLCMYRGNDYKSFIITENIWKNIVLS